MDSASVVSSAPPSLPPGAVTSAARLHSNPVFARAAGKMPARGKEGAGPAAVGARGRGGASSSAGGTEEGARYERLSLLAVELQHASRERDGAESTISFEDENSDDDDDEAETNRRAGRGASKSRRSAFLSRWTTESDAEANDNEEEEQGSDDESDDEGKAKTSKKEKTTRKGKEKKPGRDSDVADLPQASFSPMDEDEDGGQEWEKSRPSREIAMMAAAAYGAADRASDDDDDASSQRAASTASGTSSKRRRESKQAYKDLFGAKGVTCVGCALAHRIGPVETFVTENITRMSEGNLWKMAALTWKMTRMAEAEAKGVPCPPWAWKDIEMHFRYHTTHPAIGRTNMIQSLATMRHHVESRMLRVDDAGTAELDKGTADLALKIIAAESRERTALAALSAPPKGAAGKTAAAAAAAGGGSSRGNGGGGDE